MYVQKEEKNGVQVKGGSILCLIKSEEKNMNKFGEEAKNDDMTETLQAYRK